MEYLICIKHRGIKMLTVHKKFDDLELAKTHLHNNMEWNPQMASVEIVHSNT
jgi:hypothetical protein